MKRFGFALSGALAGLVLSFLAAMILAEIILQEPGESRLESGVIVWGVLGDSLLGALLVALIAWRLAQPLLAVSRAARLVAEGQLGARAPLPRRRFRRLGGASRLIEDFNTMAAALERLEAERQATTAIIAHELRTPLAVLQARLAALRDGVFALDDREVQLLIQQTELLARLVEDLRTLSLAEAGKLTLDVRPCDLSALVRDVVESFEPRAVTQGIGLEVCAQEATLRGDAARLRQVVANLVDNALRFTPEGGSVEVTLRTDEAGVTLLVRDTGPGLGEGTQARVFERFYRADAERSGSGLGLAIVRSLVELHGGRVEAMNAPGGGALFRVSLPYRNPDRNG